MDTETTPEPNITVYLTGDEDGPDLYGIIYDTEDEAAECARENDTTVWRVPALLFPALAAKIEAED